MRVFVDTSAWLACYDRHDQHHQRAISIADRLKAEQARLVLSEFILAESLTIIRYRIGHSWAVRFGRAVLESQVAELVDVDDAARRRAWEIFQRYEDKDFSFVDCTSFALMAGGGIKAAFAFDRHFEQYGFQLIDR